MDPTPFDYDTADLPLSPTGVQLYVQCPLKWYRRYHEGKREAPTVPLLIGSICHLALQYYTEGKGERTVDDCLTSAMAAIDVIPFGDLAVCPGLIKEGVDSIDFAKLMAAEQEFQIPVADVQITGLIDRVDLVGPQTIQVIDYKTSLVPMTSWEMESNLQLAMYYVAARALWPQYPQVILSLMYLRKGKMMSQVADDDLIPYLYMYLNDIVHRIQDGKFEPKLNKYCCYCHVKGECPLYDDLEDQAKATLTMPADDPQAAYEKWRRLHELQYAIDKDAKALQDVLVRGMDDTGTPEVATPGGLYRVTNRTNRSTDTQACFNILRQAGVPDAEIVGAMSFSSQGIDELLEKHGDAKPGLEQMVRAVQRFQATSSWLTHKAATPPLKKRGKGKK